VEQLVFEIRVVYCLEDRSECGLGIQRWRRANRRVADRSGVLRGSQRDRDGIWVESLQKRGKGDVVDMKDAKTTWDAEHGAVGTGAAGLGSC
jgi:hypothetical protein